MIRKILLPLTLVLCVGMAFGHPGRTDSSGGHTNRKTGEYHYHSKSVSPPASDRVVKPEETEDFYVGSAKSDKYHRPSCRYVKQINQENLVVFENKKETVQSHYVPCKVCKP